MKKRPEEWTELYKEKKLDEGDYWIKLTDGRIIVDHYTNKFDIYSFYSQGEDIVFVLDKVPDYYLWQGIEEEYFSLHCTVKLLEEQLKNERSKK